MQLHILANGRYGDFPNIAGYDQIFGRSAEAWPANNQAIYCPVTLPAAFKVSRFFVHNGNTTGNVDVGLYSGSGVRLLSTGSTARATGGDLQYISVTAQSFPAGFYYIAMVLSTTAGTVFAIIPQSTASGYLPQACGFLQEALGATTLPATMTPVRSTSPNGWNFGFTQSATL